MGIGKLQLFRENGLMAQAETRGEMEVNRTKLASKTFYKNVLCSDILRSIYWSLLL